MCAWHDDWRKGLDCDNVGLTDSCLSVLCNFHDCWSYFMGILSSHLLLLTLNLAHSVGPDVLSFIINTFKKEKLNVKGEFWNLMGYFVV